MAGPRFVRHVELEAQLQALDELRGPAADELLAVYTDYLLAHGDARAELVTEAALGRPPTADALNDLLYGWFGPTQSRVRWLELRARWQGGWPTLIEVGLRHGRERAQLRMLSSDLFTLVRSLVMRSGWRPPEQPIELRAAPMCPSLRELHLESHHAEPVEFGELPRLERLALRRAGLDALELRAPALRELELHDHAFGIAALHTFVDQLAPARPLASLECALAQPGPLGDALVELVAHPRLASLARLKLLPTYQWLSSPDELVRLAKLPQVQRLRELDLSAYSMPVPPPLPANIVAPRIRADHVPDDDALIELNGLHALLRGENDA